MADIGFDNVAKRYGETDVIRDLNLAVNPGEFMVLVGPSGCGKSTALRMIAGLETVTSGRLSIAGRVVNDVAPKDRDVAMVFQSYALYPHMSVRENIAFGLKVRKTPADEIARRVDEAARILDLGPYLDRKPKALSGGQRQRVALGRAIVRNPSVFLFDEPLSNLDAKLRTGMRAEISRLQARLGATSVYVTHDQTEAMTLGHRIAVLAPIAQAGTGGNLMQVGAPLDLYDRPDNLFVARFIGSPSMGVFAAAAEGGRLHHPAFAGGAIDPNAGARRWILRDGPVQVGVRAEDLRPVAANEPAGEGGAKLAGEVALVETLGHEVLVHLSLEGGAEIVAKSFGHGVLPRIGDRIDVRIDLAKLHLFDPETGLRLAEAGA